MIRFKDDDEAIRVALNGNQEYLRFVQPQCLNGRILIQMENGHVVLFHNNDDVFTSCLLTDEFYFFRNNVDDILRIANSIQNFAASDYRKNINS